MAKKKSRRGRMVVEAKKKRLGLDSVRYKCLDCGVEENIPKSAIEIIDIFDEGLGAPEFECKECKGTMQAMEEEKSNGTIYIRSVDSSFLDDDDIPL